MVVNIGREERRDLGGWKREMRGRRGNMRQEVGRQVQRGKVLQ